MIIIAALAGLLCCAPVVSAQSALPSLPSQNPNNDQGANYQYSSIITAVTPHVPGLTVRVQEFADRLLLSNHTGATVTIYGYQGEPYARVQADGTTEQNALSPATYLNSSFFGKVTVPAVANPQAPPRWVLVDRTGMFEWHDHRIHWSSPLLPPEVKDKGKRTFIFAWSVPISIGTRRGAIMGVLYWNPENSSAPVAIIVLGVLITLGGLLFVLFVRRRRSAEAPAAGGAGAAGGGRGSGPEAW
jgi:hypothetical protein